MHPPLVTPPRPPGRDSGFGIRDPKDGRAPETTLLKIDVEKLSFFYGETRALQDISIQMKPNVVTAFIGPSGCGKSTFLRTLNRMHDIIPGARVEGKVSIDGDDVYGPGVDVVALRRKVGMVFQKSNP